MPDESIFIGRSDKPEVLYLPLANRHGLVTGATGTGKTVSLQILAEGFSNSGVPVFAADITGDLSGLAEPGEPKDALVERARQVGLDDYGFEAAPVIFWDLHGEHGHPVRRLAFAKRVGDDADLDQFLMRSPVERLAGTRGECIVPNTRCCKMSRDQSGGPDHGSTRPRREAER